MSEVESGVSRSAGRLARPSFLASPSDARYVSGTVLGVAGGKPVF